MVQRWVSRIVTSLKDIPASESAATGCPLDRYIEEIGFQSQKKSAGDLKSVKSAN